MKDQNQYHVLISLDPAEPELRPSDASLSWLKNWVNERNASTEGVYVAFGSSGVPLITEAGLLDQLKTMNLGKDNRAKVLVEKSSSRRKAVDALIQYAKNNESDLIVVTSHGRSGPGRLVLGSFAESLLAASSVPVLFLCESADHSKLTNKVLFPTDLSQSSHRAFDLFLEQMKGTQSEIILYHAVSPPGAIFDTGMMGVPVYLPESYWLEQKQWSNRECDLMLKRAIAQGFKARVVIQDGVLNTPMAIQKFAESENVDLIGMASVSRGFESAVLGSIAKEIFRLRKWPVWVCGPETAFERKSK